MMMLQKPVHLLASPSSHRRHPSAPPAVLVQPTRVPGLLSLSRPPTQTPPRPANNQQQNYQNNQRQPRSTHTKQSRAAGRQSLPNIAALPPQPEEATKAPAPAARAAKSHTPSAATSAVSDKPPRGRQSAKQAKDKSTTRSPSQSLVRKNNSRRYPAQHHQGSPPNTSTLISSQAEANNNRPAQARSQSLHLRQHNPFDPFLVSSESESDNPPSTPAKANPPVRPAPKLASRPTGKLARRRENVPDALSTPTPSKAVSVPRSRNQARPRESRAMNLSRSVPALSTIPSGNSAVDVFPICDDLTDAEDGHRDDDDDVFLSSTPSHIKGGPVTWQQSLVVYDDGPRTAPLSSPRGGFPFNTKPISTPTPERRRQHVRSPSEGVFNLPMDEDTSFSSLSDASEELKAMVGLVPRRRIASAASTPMGKKNFWASSKFQNSPSPDTLPVPAFKVQATV
ncbi:hypothetical protein BC834DRAFT_971904 [Gloeopeniophorella convolvens]|nr:hypothetical protein BC834DRAFT_971904 [Gloeopeniophorella convolvens]